MTRSVQLNVASGLSPLIADITSLLRRGSTRVKTELNASSGAWQAPVILIDGSSGSGKTTLAAMIRAHLQAAHLNVQFVAAENYFPGWHGLAAGTRTTELLLMGRNSANENPTVTSTRATVPHMVPSHLARTDSPITGYRQWDWVEEKFGRTILLDRHRPLIIEGCGTITPLTSSGSDLRIWVQAHGGTEERQQRALERDGDIFAPWWQVWAAQDEAHLMKHHPHLHATHTVTT